MRDFSEKEALRKVKQSWLGEASWTGTFQQLDIIVQEERESHQFKSHTIGLPVCTHNNKCVYNTHTHSLSRSV